MNIFPIERTQDDDLTGVNTPKEDYIICQVTALSACKKVFIWLMTKNL